MGVSMTILGSGSAGNSIYIEAGESRVLVDAGLSPRQLRERLALIGRSPETLSAILISHEHNDHIRGLKGIADKLGIPVYCNGATRDAIREILEISLNLHVFHNGATFSIGDIDVHPFSVPHDAQDPVGFLIQTQNLTVAIITDLGHVTTLVTERIRTANAIVLETNHDRQMLIDCPTRPWKLKQRIMSSFGHLSNEEAAEALKRVLWDGLHHVYLAHISRECNTPMLAYSAIKAALSEAGAQHVRALLTYQDAPADPLIIP
jgi:phosphoribosyl 1,2-cyclic phosphodiesterase